MDYIQRGRFGEEEKVEDIIIYKQKVRKCPYPTGQYGVCVCPGDVSGTGYDPSENLSKAICEPTSNHSFVYCMTHHQIVHRIHNPVASPNIRSPSIRIKPTQPTTTTDRIATTHDPRPSRQATKRRRPPPQSRRRRKSHPRSLCKVYRPTEV